MNLLWILVIILVVLALVGAPESVRGITATDIIRPGALV
jgi:hypothetical protein